MDMRPGLDLIDLDRGLNAKDRPTIAAASNPGKRTVDVLIALLVLVFTLPLLLFVALCILAESRGPVLFMQRRTGLGGKPIRVYKFRTMTVMEDGEDIRQATPHDPRVTRVGAVLRRSSIDELPQLVNILKGEMSLVGPRPHALAHDDFYGTLVPNYARRFRAKPGITGLAQVSGLRGEIRSLDGMIDRVDLDNTYIEQWTLALDLKILAKTAVAVFQDGAY